MSICSLSVCFFIAVIQVYEWNKQTSTVKAVTAILHPNAQTLTTGNINPSQHNGITYHMLSVISSLILCLIDTCKIK